MKKPNVDKQTKSWMIVIVLALAAMLAADLACAREGTGTEIRSAEFLRPGYCTDPLLHPILGKVDFTGEIPFRK